jgi:acyl carrier protein
VAAIVATVLGSAVSNDQPLMAAGLDSLGAVELRNALAAAFGTELPPTMTLDYPTVSALATRITHLLAHDNSAAMPAETALEAAHDEDEMEIEVRFM